MQPISSSVIDGPGKLSPLGHQLDEPLSGMHPVLQQLDVYVPLAQGRTRTLHRRVERNLPRTVHHRPRRHALCGYWKLVERRVLVPATFEWRRDSCGRYYRVCVRHSYYKTVQTRVWVNSVRHHSRR